MKTTPNLRLSPHRRAMRRMLPVLFACLTLGAAAQQPGVQGVLVAQDGRRLEGRVRWLNVAREYEVTLASGVALTLNPQQVAEVQVQPPPGIQEAVNNVRQGRDLSSAIAVLDRIAQSYLRLQWDVPATRWLTEAHLKNNDAAAAVRVSERVTAVRPDAGYASEMAVPYWRALLALEREARLSDLLDQAMASGSRSMIARALVMRGDILHARGEYRNALKDGYLRVVLLLRAERDIQPEALFKAIKSFEALGEISYAQRMRQTLMSEFGTSEYAQRIQSGG